MASITAPKTKAAAADKKSLLSRINRDKHFLLMLAIPFAMMMVFRVTPILGNIIAFRRFRMGGPLLGDQWIGLQHFHMFLNDPLFWDAFRNSVTLAIINLAIGFPAPIILALLINEIPNGSFKRVTQTITQLPRFLATVIVISILREMLAMETGIINQAIMFFGGDAIHFLNRPEWFRLLFVGSATWQWVGFTSIIYLAALTSVDPQLYEAASIDGAGRIKQILHISLPGIKITVVYMMLLSIGQMLNLGLDRALLLYTPSNAATADIIETYVFRIGLEFNRFSYATAVGLFGSIIGVTLLTTSNFLSKKFADIGFF
ncbi:MAG: ABC transporter permease subunit [Defluviitaleaceae bacterium]|nr:ABC transporter permease subunit [Defluviitaleaceae bacterium]